jgi:cell division protein ZapA
MPDKANNVTVRIFDEEYPIAGVSDPDYITKVADYVDTKMREAALHSRVHARDKVAILAALSIASELHERDEQVSTVKSDRDDRIDQMIVQLESMLDGASG